MREVAAPVDLEQGKVAPRVAADNIRNERPVVVGSDLRGLAVADEVIVGHRIAIRRNEKAGSLGHQNRALGLPMTAVRCALRRIFRSTLWRCEFADEAVE